MLAWAGAKGVLGRWRARAAPARATGCWPRSARPDEKPSVWALPKGLIDEGEKPEQTAVREVAEETGIEARLVTKLGDVRYVYTWARRAGLQGRQLLPAALRAAAGSGRSPPEQKVEVAEARWFPLEEAPRVLAYKGEREMAEKALAFVRAGGL